MREFADIDELLGADELGTSGWQVVDQARIDRFAEVTGDHQWIHVDPVRARAEGPFGATIAHGALTLSLCTAFLGEVFRVKGVTFVVNAGFDRVRFQAPVPAGSRLRGVISRRESRRFDDGARVVVRIRAEIEGQAKPACVADQVLACYAGKP